MDLSHETLTLIKNKKKKTKLFKQYSFTLLIFVVTKIKSKYVTQGNSPFALCKVLFRLKFRIIL